MSASELQLWKRVLDIADPVRWLAENTQFHAWPHQQMFLQDAHTRTRVVCKSRKVGMTTTIAHEALWKAITNPARRILIISPGLRQSRIPMDKIHHITKLQNLAAKVAEKSRDTIQFTNASTITALPNNPDRVRGYDATDIYLDEAAHFLNDRPVMRALEPMLISRKGTLTLVSTPFGKRGLFWNRYQTAKLRQDPDLKAYDFKPSTLNPLITQAELEREHEDYTETEFRQEYLGEFIEEVDTCFPLDLITPCVDNNLQPLTKGEPAKKYFMGIDLAKQRDETVVTILEKHPETNNLTIRHISAWTKMNYTEQTARIQQLATLFPIENSAVDQTGVGEAVVENLKAALPYIQGVTFTQQVKVQLIDSTRILLEQKKLTLPNNPKLITQLNSLRYTFTHIGNKVFHTPETNQPHDDYVWSLTLAIHAALKPRPTLMILGAKPRL